MKNEYENNKTSKTASSNSENTNKTAADKNSSKGCDCGCGNK